jgi:hypothetical protein
MPFIAFTKPQKLNSIDFDFLCWFIGFVEGDGSFVISNKRFILI